MVIDFHVERTLIWITITNLGPSLAQDVRFAFEPPLRSSRDDPSQLTPLSQTQLFTSGIPSLAPGKKITAIFDHFPGRETKRTHGEDFPDAYNVTITYRNEELGRSYTDVTTIDLGVYRNLVHATRHDLHDIHAELKTIRDLLKKWTSAAPSGLRTVTRKDIREYQEELEQEWRERQQEQPEQSADDTT